MHHVQQVAEAIDERLTEIHHEIASLHAARAAIGVAPGSGDTQTATRDPRRPARPASRPARPASRPARSVRRSAVTGEAVEGLLAADGEMATADVALRAGAETRQVRELLRELEADDRICRAGSGRATRWRLITDEDRIAARVAELERQRAAVQTG